MNNEADEDCHTGLNPFIGPEETAQMLGLDEMDLLINMYCGNLSLLPLFLGEKAKPYWHRRDVELEVKTIALRRAHMRAMAAECLDD